MDKEIKFSEVPIGARFFDPYSGDFWEKVSNNTASYEAIDAAVDVFEVDDLVIVEV